MGDRNAEKDKQQTSECEWLIAINFYLTRDWWPRFSLDSQTYSCARRWKFFCQMKPVDFPGKTNQTKEVSVKNCLAFFKYLTNACHPPWAMCTPGRNTEISILLTNRNFQIAKFFLLLFSCGGLPRMGSMTLLRSSNAVNCNNNNNNINNKNNNNNKGLVEIQSR